MFGYVMADADRLSDKDAARYRAAYCGSAAASARCTAPGGG